MPANPEHEILGQHVAASRAVGGGCIDDARAVELADGTRCFVKFARDADAAARLAAEADGLRRLAPHIRVPRVLEEGKRHLALEWLDMRPPSGPRDAEALGSALAALHRHHGTAHGLDRDNFIGPTPQENAWSGDWAVFFTERRLRPLIVRLGRLPGESGILRRVAERLAGHHPAPSLLHGDLWSGNHAMAGGAPVVFDPAVYFGDAEADLAMLELFGPRLGDAFWRGYGGEPNGREARRPVYDLYHALNHLIIFGPSYEGMVRGSVAKLGGE